MVVRIRFGKQPKPAAKRARNRRFAQGIAALLKPAALMALALGMWGIGADLKLTSAFAIRSGWLSLWQFWLGTAALRAVLLCLEPLRTTQNGLSASPAPGFRPAGRANRRSAGVSELSS